jgi:uncharacterized repeat protein (TIGR04076 family)
MADVKIKVAKICGRCNAALEIGDTFILRGYKISPLGNEKSCQVAWMSIINNVGRLRLNNGPIYVACPDPAMGEGGNVIFKLSVVEENETN